MSSRRRDLSPYVNLGVHRYESVDSFLSRPIAAGVSSIKGENRWFDMFYEDHSAETTLVVFPAAFPTSRKTYPFFVGRGMARSLNTNYLCFADPASGGNEALPTFWYLNTRRVPTETIIPAAIQLLLDSRPGQRLIFFGASAGGFGALKYGAQFPGSCAFVMNPRIDLHSRPNMFAEYAVKAYPGADPARLSRRLLTNVATLYSEPRGNHIVYLQNSQDKNYFTHHFPKFEKIARGRPDFHAVVEPWGKGHVVPPAETYMALLEELVESNGSWGRARAPSKGKSET